jgi:hypothetical protein
MRKFFAKKIKSNCYVGTGIRTVSPKEAVEYVCTQPAIQSMVHGASTKNHIVQTKKLIEDYSIKYSTTNYRK